MWGDRRLLGRLLLWEPRLHLPRHAREGHMWSGCTLIIPLSHLNISEPAGQCTLARPEEEAKQFLHFTPALPRPLSALSETFSGWHIVSYLRQNPGFGGGLSVSPFDFVLPLSALDCPQHLIRICFLMRKG